MNRLDWGYTVAGLDLCYVDDKLRRTLFLAEAENYARNLYLMVCCFVVTHLNSTRQAASRHHQSSVSLLKCISADSSSFEERRVSFDQQDIEVSFRYHRSGEKNASGLLCKCSLEKKSISALTYFVPCRWTENWTSSPPSQDYLLLEGQEDIPSSVGGSNKCRSLTAWFTKPMIP